MPLHGFRQTALEFAGQEVHIFFVEHRFMAASDLEHPCAPGNQAVPAGMKIPIPPVRPVSRLKKNNVARVSPRPIDKRSWVDNGIQILQVPLVDGQTQGVTHPPISHAGSAMNTRHSIAHVFRQFLPTKVPQMMTCPPQQQLGATLMGKILVVRWILGVKHRQQGNLLPLLRELPRHFVGDHSVHAQTSKKVWALGLYFLQLAHQGG